MSQSEWWRSAVIYQVYPRSFSDGDGDGIGDLPGITSRLPDVKDLGVDAIWLSPFYPSPQRDGGYDVADYCDVDPVFGTIEDFDELISRAHENELRVIVDIVPNHTSSEHSWFREALASPEGSSERDRYFFRDGRGEHGECPPNNWQSVFGGPAWTRVTRVDGVAGQWYLHLFDSGQPDLNWDSSWVQQQFRDVLRFWLNRGVDGFRVDVAHGLAKPEGLPDYFPSNAAGESSSASWDLAGSTPPYWAQDGVHEIFREWRAVVDEYDGDRVLVAEAWVRPLTKLANWVRPDEMHQAFNFTYLETHWSAPELREVIEASLAAFGAVGAPSTWVLSNHDVVRHSTRLALRRAIPQGHGIGPNSTEEPDQALGLRRARAATALMLALPGSSYLFQGEELGLPEVIDLPDSARQDPTYFRTRGTRYGRDGCRVPIPWDSSSASYGFSTTGDSWLPQPSSWNLLTRETQSIAAGSTLELYRRALRLRTQYALGEGTLNWLPGYNPDVVALSVGELSIMMNLGASTIDLPEGDVLLATSKLNDHKLPQNATVWIAT